MLTILDEYTRKSTATSKMRHDHIVLILLEHEMVPGNATHEAHPQLAKVIDYPAQIQHQHQHQLQVLGTYGGYRFRQKSHGDHHDVRA